MLRSMTGFGRCCLEDALYAQIWEVRSVNGRHLDIRWRLPYEARAFEGAFEKLLKRHASRGRVEISLVLTPAAGNIPVPVFNEHLANTMLNRLEDFAASRGDLYEPDLNRLMGISSLWQAPAEEADEGLQASLLRGLDLALQDWNESRCTEAKALAKDLHTRMLLMDSWIALVRERAPQIKEERFAAVQERLMELLARVGSELDESRFLQEIALMADKLDVSEELTRLQAHMERLRELLGQGTDTGRKLDFTLQECFREVTTCGNKIQDLQVSRLVVDLKNELEKCREQVQNLE